MNLDLKKKCYVSDPPPFEQVSMASHHVYVTVVKWSNAACKFLFSGSQDHYQS